jgi:hypothetical protein
VKIEALLFDMGKVVLDFDFELGMEKLAGKCGLPPEAFKKVLFDKDWIRPYERGEISTADYHRYLCETGQLQMDLADFWSPTPTNPTSITLRSTTRFFSILT